MIIRRFALALAFPILLAASTATYANLIYMVSLNTTSIAGGNYTLAFQLTDGSGTGDANNTATLSSFNFGGGALPDALRIARHSEGRVATPRLQ